MKIFITIVLPLFFFTACSKVNVVLLPEDGDKIGKIEIQNEDKKFVIDKPFEQVNAIDGDSSILTQEEVQEKFKDSITALPKKPKSYLIYFEWDSTKVVPKSKKEIKKIIENIKKENTNYIHIIGHTDRAGDNQYNKKLSLKRANYIKKILIKNKIPKEIIEIDYYGESAPLVKTQDGVPRKINRRVEVTVK